MTALDLFFWRESQGNLVGASRDGWMMAAGFVCLMGERQRDFDFSFGHGIISTVLQCRVNLFMKVR
jgi:hypothetical protein